MVLPNPDEDCQPIRIPYPSPEDQGDPYKMEQNWKEVERWTNYMIKNCLCHTCSGGG